MVEADTSSPASIAADVSTRYGVAVCPSVVQVCPPRTFAASTPVWDGRTRTLVYPDADARKAAFKKAIWAGAARARAAARDPAIEARRATLAQMHAQGLSVRQIAEALSISYCTSLADHRLAGLTPNAFVTSAMTQSAVRAKRVAQLHAEGWTVKAIAAHLGITNDTVRDLARKHHGLKFERKVAAVCRQPSKSSRPPLVISMASVRVNVDQRQAQLAAMLDAGQSLAAIAKKLGVTTRQLRRDCRDIGVGPSLAGRPRANQVAA